MTTLEWDQQVLEALGPVLAAGAEAPPLAVGDVEGRREAFTALVASRSAEAPQFPDVHVSEHATTAEDGQTIPLYRYYKDVEQPGSLLVYFHGGGMILGSVDMYEASLKAYVSATGVPIIAPEYRLAPEHPFPVPVEDCYASLLWVAQNASELDVDAGRIVVGGDSAGGNLAAAVALMARDRGGPAPAAQLLVYPMLDDRNLMPDPALGDMLTWTYDDNVTGWRAYLADSFGTGSVSAYAAPARAEDLGGLPMAFLDVGGNDIFRDEGIEYARRLWRAGVPTELHVYPSGPHGYESLAPGTDLAQRTLQARYGFLRSI